MVLMNDDKVKVQYWMIAIVFQYRRKEKYIEYFIAVVPEFNPHGIPQPKNILSKHYPVYLLLVKVTRLLKRSASARTKNCCKLLLLYQ